ncbi:porin family protein [Flavivirga eckloniae]|uniref:Outer membrane protein beta-barrel domain-containing protein n=1 Tax=Flavivirga eckloniae TaxID=1803846 RepID=A0A2K9PPV4_9FLAO|nr:porin family protein [Flavivirga eckloniae]AUP79075.1 hypothetical protein C1H87_10335 [Flavivirga eckloniae]
MKNLFLLAIAITSFSLTSNAQNIKFGFKAGVNFAALSGDSNTLGSSLDGRTGYHIGAVAQLGIAKKFAIQPEVLYSAQGLKDVDVDYINVPVLVKFKFAKFFSVEAGPQLGFVINNDIPKESEPKDFNFSGVIGVGAEYKSYFVQLRFTPGGVGKHNLGSSLVGTSSQVQNEMLQISIGYYIF